MADIFVSYSQKDRAWVKRLVDALTAEGWEVWWDLKIRAGESFDQVIENTLEHVSCVVGVWSSNSVKSEWVRAESAWAKDCDRFVSIQIDNDLQLPLKFYHVHTANMAGWDGSRKSSSFRSLVRDISSLASLPESDEKHPDPLSTFQDHLHDGGEGPKMVVIPAGSFWMGSPSKEHKKTEVKLLRPMVAGLPIQNDGPRHWVEISRCFAMGETPVTFGDYDRFAEATGKKRPPDEGWGRGRRPVINVTWNDAMDYADWLCSQTGRSYRLPSEAEWEYAARAGSQGRWSFGDNASELSRYAWYGENSGGKTHPVGQKQPNSWGLHDVHGNVWEWVEDCWHNSYKGAPDDGSVWGEEEPGNCERRVVRGASWNGYRNQLSSTIRDSHKPSLWSIGLGFRLAVDV